MAITKSMFAILDEIANIKDKKERMEALRVVCGEKRQLATIIQYTYHPDVEFDLPAGELPTSIWKPALHDDYSATYRIVKTLPNYSIASGVPRKRKEINFAALCETVVAEDVPLLIGMKDKKLPWRKLGENFCKQALPELFPTPTGELKDDEDEE